MSVISMKALLESGVHFGHRTNKWDPHMRPFIFTERNGIHIIDLQQTVKSLTTAYNLVRDTVLNGGAILFVGTKRQAQETVKEEAMRCGMPFVTERWLGGMLTNWSTMYLRISELDRLSKMRDSGDYGRLTKKEILLINREITRLETHLSGVRDMKRVPELLFVVDVSREDTAIHEANLVGVPVIAMVDTNCDPRGVDYVIPSNDDAIRAIKLMVSKIADAVIEGKASRKDEDAGEFELSTPILAEPHRPVMDDEVELEDKDLLGAATLAKLGPVVEEVVAVEEVAKPKKAAKAEVAVAAEEEVNPVKVVEAEEAAAPEEAVKPKKAAKTAKAVAAEEEVKPEDVVASEE